MPAQRPRAVGVTLRLLAALAGLLLFVLALELLKRGAGGVAPWLRALGVSGLSLDRPNAYRGAKSLSDWTQERGRYYPYVRGPDPAKAVFCRRVRALSRFSAR